MTEKKKTRRRLVGEVLIEAGLIDERQLATALGQQQKWGGRIGSELVRLGFIGEEELAYVLQEQLGIKWLTLHDRQIPPDVLNMIPIDVVRKFHVIPVAFSGNTVTIATVNPNDFETLDTIAFLVGKKIKPVIATESDIRMAITKYYERLSLAKKKGPRKPLKPQKKTPLRTEEDFEKPSDETVRQDRWVEKLRMRSPKAQEAMIRLLIKKGFFSAEEFFREVKEID